LTKRTLIEKYPLRRRKILKKTLSWSLSILLLMIIFLNIYALILIFPLMIIVFIYQIFYFKSYFYDLSEGELVIKKGVLHRKETTIPLNKIQDVYLDQDILDRIFGLWDLHISTGSEVSGFEAHIDGVGEKDARIMRNILLKKTVFEEERVKEVYFPDKRGLIIMGFRSFFIISLLIIFILLFLLSSFSSILSPFLLILILLVFICLLILNFLEFNAIRYELRDEGVFIKRGFITPRESLLLYRNIQDVEETQDILDIFLGIKNLLVKTMSGLSVSESKMEFLSPEIAKKLRKKILGLSRRSSQAKIEYQKVATDKDIEFVKKPYPNHFIKSMIYSTIINFVPISLIIILLSLILKFYIGIFIGLGVFIILSILALINTIILSMTYSYSISQDFISIKLGLFNIRKKQINYNKIQDLETNITFPQSFAGLSSLKLETGSKEIIDKEYRAVAYSRLVESIPDLDFIDAVNLRNKIAKFMGVSLKGIGENSLVSKFPLETIKPLKKTLWWIIYLVPVLVCTFSYLRITILLILISFLIIVGKYIYEYYYYKKYFYDMNDEVLVIRKGVFGSRELVIPFSKIQDIFIDQDILDRLFNLRDLYVSTVTNRSILNAHIDGINPEKAEKIATMLINAVIEKT